MASILKDKRSDLHKEPRHCELKYHRSKEVFRSVMDCESKFRKEMASIRNECKAYRTEVDRTNDRKYEHLKKKYRGEVILDLDPTLTRYSDLQIFARMKTQEKEDEVEIVYEQDDDN